MRSGTRATATRITQAAAAAVLAAVLCGCASGPGRAPARGADGPGLDPPSDLASRADAEPRIEAIRSGGPNKPYQVLGRSYVPETRDVPFRERGLASWYGRKFHGRMTSSGEPYDMYAMTAAHPTLPIPSYARITNPANGRAVLVRINDRGPFVPGRIVDLSYTAALKLDLLRGVAPVELERITGEEIRTGAWRRGSVPTDAGEPAQTQLAAAVPPPAAASPTPPPQRASETPVASAVPAQDVVLVTAGDEVAAAQSTRGWWVQLGAFRQREGAESVRRRVAADGELGWLESLLTIVSDSAMHRLQAGPYPSRADAERAGERARVALGVVPVIVERR